MKKYRVGLCFTGYKWLEVEAESEDAAHDKAESEINQREHIPVEDFRALGFCRHGGGNMTAAKLKALYERNNPQGHWFDRDTMRFFGDTMCNFGVCDGGRIKVLTDRGIEEAEVWDLYRRRPVNGGLHGHSTYFRKDNGQPVDNHE